MRRGILIAAVALVAAGLPASAVRGATFSNATPIILDPADFAPGNPYPSSIVVGGLPGGVVAARATLYAISHMQPNGLDVLLVAPDGRHTLLISARCGNTAVTGLTLTFDDAAAGSLPASNCTSGTYRPSKAPTFDPTFEPPAPAGDQTTTAMAALNGAPANGTWDLFARTPATSGSGSIGGWSLELLTNAVSGPQATCAGRPATITGTAGPDKLGGTKGPDVIAGLDGNDQISGLAGADVVCGGNGKDLLRGGKGKDRLFGEAGKDRAIGGKGRDRCIGGQGRDTGKGCEKEKSL